MWDQHSATNFWDDTTHGIHADRLKSDTLEIPRWLSNDGLPRTTWSPGSTEHCSPFSSVSPSKLLNLHGFSMIYWWLLGRAFPCRVQVTSLGRRPGASPLHGVVWTPSKGRHPERYIWYRLISYNVIHTHGRYENRIVIHNVKSYINMHTLFDMDI